MINPLVGASKGQLHSRDKQQKGIFPKLLSNEWRLNALNSETVKAVVMELLH